MIDVNELWIGDILRLKKSGRVGRFEGVASGSKIKVKVLEKVILTPISNVEYASESDLPPVIIAKSAKPQKIKPSEVGHKLEDSIDLHIEVLNPHMSHAHPERIVATQLAAAKTFIELSIQRKTRIIEIIHGKGQGVLKAEVRHLLSLYDEVQFTFDKNNGGSTEAWLSVS